VPSYGIIAIAAVIARSSSPSFFKATWRVAEPNEALIISGLGGPRRHQPGDRRQPRLRSSVARAPWWLPGFQTSRRLVLDSRAANLEVVLR